MMMRMGCKLAMGAAGLAVVGAFAVGALAGAAGAAMACAAGGKFRPPGARWPAEPQASPAAGVTSSEDAA